MSAPITRFCLSCMAALCAWTPCAAAAQGETAPGTLQTGLELEPGATCLQREGLLQRAQEWLGGDRLPPGTRIVVRGSQTDHRSVTIELLESDRVIATRRFDPGPEACASLHAAVGLAIALALKANLLEEIGLQPPAPQPQPPPPPPPSEPPTRRISHTARISFAPSYDVVPELGWGLTAGVDFGLGSWLAARTAVLAAYAPNRSFPDVSGEFDTLIVAAQLSACAAGDLTQGLQLRVCAGLAGGPLYAHGHGFESSQDATRLWLAVVNNIDADIRLTDGWALGIGAAVALPVLDRTVDLRRRDNEIVAERELEQAGFMLQMGPVWRF